MNFSSPRSNTSRRYSLTSGNFAAASFLNSVEMAAPSSTMLDIDDRISLTTLAFEGTIGTLCRRFSGNSCSTSFFNRLIMTDDVRTMFNSVAFRAPTTRRMVLPPPMRDVFSRQYRLRNACGCGSPGTCKPASCGCSSSGAFRVGVPDNNTDRVAAWRTCTTAFVRCAFHSLMLWDSSHTTMRCGSPPGRVRNFAPVLLSASRLYEMTHMAALRSRSVLPLVITCTLSLLQYSGSHVSA
mmetsp:Transcript_92159/g.282084  ORF Transcript_92159/g.282084 Transcript_92159/m.282084 type:complete len:239 (-) Transcript_92159:159-875(-)